MATSIIGAAYGSHPAWRPPTRPPMAAPGLAASGGAGLGAGPISPPPAPRPAAPAAPPPPPAAAPTHAVTTTVTPSPPDLSGANWEGYLSPDQLGTLRQAGITYADTVGQWQRRAADAQTAYSQQVGNAQYAHDVNTARANEEMAARGLSVSSIRANDLTDINRTLTDATAAASASLNTLISEATAAIGDLQTGAGGTLGASFAATQNQFMGDAALNAAGMAQFQPYQQTTQVPNAPVPASAPPPAGPQVTNAPHNGSYLAPGYQTWLAGALAGRAPVHATGGAPAPPRPAPSIGGRAIQLHPNWGGRR